MENVVAAASVADAGQLSKFPVALHIERFEHGWRLISSIDARSMRCLGSRQKLYYPAVGLCK